MPLCEIKLCDSFKINRIFCCSKKNKVLSEDDFKLIKTKHKKYKKLVPKNYDYIFLKVLDDSKIISATGKLMSFFTLKEKDLLDKKLEDVKKCQPLFSEYIEPLFNSCLENNLAYQFDFEVKEKKFSCSLYPCHIPNDIVSIDIVIRPSHNYMTNREKNQFILS